MAWDRIALSLIPVPVFYLIYYRYFTFRPEIGKHVESLLYGIAFALALVVAAPIVYPVLAPQDDFLIGFFSAALIEKTGAFIIIYLIQRHFPNFSIMEATLSAMIYGIGFSVVENIFYAATYGDSLIILRIVFTVPLHLTTCGIMGYYSGMRKMCSTGMYKFVFSLKAFLLPVMLHGIFDSFLIMGGALSFSVSPLLIVMVLFLEFYLAKAQTIIPVKMLGAFNLRLEEWLTINRQRRYERWILQSMGMPGTEDVSMLVWRPGYIRIFLVFFFMIAAIFGLSYRGEIMDMLQIIMRREEEIILLGIFPSSISIIMILVGAVNPNFFKKSEIKMPVISDVDVRREHEMDEVFITYDITSVNCFLRTAEPLEAGTILNMTFEFPGLTSREVQGVVVWENHTNRQEAIGTIVRIEAPALHYRFFIVRYNLFRFRKGTIFLLRLPGFEHTRKLFMRPISTMQEDRLFEAGSIVFKEGDRGDHFYLLKKGKVILYKTKDTGEIITMDTADAGEVFGEMSIISNTVRATTAKCVTDCIIAVAGRDNMKALIVNNVEFAQRLIQSLIERLENSEQVLVQNINMLEKQKREVERYYHVAILLTLIGLGIRPTQDNFNLDIDFTKIAEVVRHMDDDVAGEIINLVLKRDKSAGADLNVMNEEVSKIVDNLYDRFRVNIKK